MKFTRIIDLALGFLMDIVPFVCAFFIVTWAGVAYAEGYGIFVPQGFDRAGEGHTEMVTITEEEAGSPLAVGKVLEEQKLIRTRFAFAVKAKLSGYDGAILPGTFILSSDMTTEQILAEISVPPGTEKPGQDTGEDRQDAGEQEKSSHVKENRDVWGQ